MEEIETWVLLYIFCNLESAKYCVLVYKDKGIGCLHISTHLDLIKKTKPELKYALIPSLSTSVRYCDKSQESIKILSNSKFSTII